MPRAVSRNNIIAGVFVLASIILAVAISIWVSGATERLIPTRPYTVRFGLQEGTAGIKPGSSVTLGGQEVGRVTTVTFFPPEGKPTFVDVHINVRSSITLYEDAWAFLERPLLGSMSSINLARVGGEPDPQTGAAAKVLHPDGILIGSIAPPSFLAQAGFGPDQVRQFRAMIGQASNVMERIDRVTAQFEKEMEPDLKTFRGAIEDVKDITGQFRDKTPGWTKQTDEILAKVNDASGRLNPLADQISGTLADADNAIKNLQDVVQQNRPALAQSIQNILDASQGWREGAGSFQDTAHRINSLVQEQTPSLRDMLANFRLAADQVKLTTVEVRRSPWRIFHTPTTKELREESLYDAAEAYASAVSDLRSASDSLAAVSQASPGSPPVTQETVLSITHRLQTAFQRYSVAEQELLRQMEKK